METEGAVLPGQSGEECRAISQIPASKNEELRVPFTKIEHVCRGLSLG